MSKKKIKMNCLGDFIGSIKCPNCKKEITMALMPINKAMICWWKDEDSKSYKTCVEVKDKKG